MRMKPMTMAMMMAGVISMATAATAGNPASPAAPTAAPAPAPAPAAAAAPKGDEAAMMAQMAKFMEPNENHKKLKPLVGKWDVVTKFWMAPGEKPMESKATADVKLVFGDRFIQQDFKGSMMGKPFIGRGMTGFDTAKNKYVSSWIDNGSTSMVSMEGTIDGAGKVITEIGTAFDPMTGKNKNVRYVTTIESDKKHTFESFEAGPDGKEMKVMELVYSRK